MRRLQIGMWQNMSEEEWNKWNMGMINGLEASQYENEDDWGKLQVFCQGNHLSFGIHSPVFRYEKVWLPQITSKDEQKRSEADRWIENEVAFASKYGAEYILFHYPFPSITPKSIDFDYWPSKLDFPTREQFLEISHEVFSRLTYLQEKYKKKIVLEYDFFGDFEEEFLEMFEMYKDIQLVIDTQRLDVHKRAFPGFNPFRFLQKRSILCLFDTS